VLPELVPEDRLQAASGLEATAMGAANVFGPAIGAALIVWIGPANVLLLDAGTYFLFAVFIMLIKAPLARPERSGVDAADQRSGWTPVVRLVARDRFLRTLTLSFAAFNVSSGALLVALPWLAKFEYDTGPGILGLMLAALAAGELIGSVVSGTLKTSDRQMLRIGVLQLFAGGVLLFLATRSLPLVAAGLLLSGVLSAPMTVLGTVVRLTRIPGVMRGRAMTLMRTIQAGALPVGAAVGGLLLSGGRYLPLILFVAVLAAAPGAFTAVGFYRASFRVAERPETAAGARPETAADVAPDAAVAAVQ
jgi:predicted MFS family arabinose efflux permease